MGVMRQPKLSPNSIVGLGNLEAMDTVGKLHKICEVILMALKLLEEGKIEPEDKREVEQDQEDFNWWCDHSISIL